MLKREEVRKRNQQSSWESGKNRIRKNGNGYKKGIRRDTNLKRRERVGFWLMRGLCVNSETELRFHNQHGGKGGESLIADWLTVKHQ